MSIINEDFLDDFLVFENKNSLFLKKANEVHYWHLIRFHVFSCLQKQLFSTEQSHDGIENGSMINRLRLKVKNIRYIVFNNPNKIKHKDILIFNHNRRVKNGKFYDCLYTDILLDHLKHSYAVIERPYLESHFQPIQTDNIYYTDFYEIIVAVKKRFIKLFRNKTILEKDIINNLVDDISSFFGVNLEKTYWKSYIENSIMNYLLYKKVYTKLLTKIRPKIILEVVSYDIQRFSLNSVAKDLGIPIIELQHGTMGKYHIAYNFKEKMNLATFPDYIFTFGQFWKDVTRFPIDQKKIKVTGWPYFERKIKQNSLDNKKNNSKKIVLFISQGPIGKKLTRFALECYNELDKSKYDAILKLHPGEYSRWKKEYPWLLDTEMQIVDNNDYDMHHFFSMVDIQVGVNSTAIFEGLGYNLDTYIYNIYGHKYMEELYNSNYATLIDSTEDFLQSITNEKTLHKSTQFEYFWKNDSLNNTINEIEKIIKEDSNG